LQCYEGIDINNAVYEWAYARQLLHIRMLETAGESRDSMEREIFSPRFLVKRPLLQALDPDPAGPPVLLMWKLTVNQVQLPVVLYLLK